jgi:hypothetical protein
MRKMLTTAAVVAAALLALPVASSYAGMDEMSAQGMMQEGEGGASRNTPGAGTAQGPVLQPARPGVRMAHPTRTRHVKRSRHMRSTVGSR